MAPLPQNLIQTSLPSNQFVDEVTPKHQIYVHHTASSGDPYAVKDYWCSNGEAVSTAFLIARSNGINKKYNLSYRDGDIMQCFSSAKWGWHLGLKKKDLVTGGKSSKWLNQSGIGIEICNWGYLTPNKDGDLVSYAKKRIVDNEILTPDKPYRGYLHWEKYTDAQLESTRSLLRYLCDRYEIDKTYKGDGIFDISPRCLKGERGIWTHTSVRKDKWDCFPQKELIQMLSSL